MLNFCNKNIYLEDFCKKHCTLKRDTFLYFRISLNTMTLQVDSPTVYTSQGVPISVTGIAQVLDSDNVIISPNKIIYF